MKFSVLPLPSCTIPVAMMISIASSLAIFEIINFDDMICPDYDDNYDFSKDFGQTIVNGKLVMPNTEGGNDCKPIENIAFDKQQVLIDPYRNTMWRSKNQRTYKDFFDVTIACEDEQMQAHKVMLSVCSPFFQNILRMNPHQHPLLYLKGVKYTDLQSVLNFMHHGEVRVAQDELNSFLEVAEDLRMKSLTQSQGNSSSSYPREKSPPKVSKSRPVEREPPPPKRPKPVTQIYSSVQTFSEDDDIQELPAVKTEPREAPVYQPSVVPSNHTVTTPVAEPQLEQHHQVVQQDHATEQYREEEVMGKYEDYGHFFPKCDPPDKGMVQLDSDEICTALLNPRRLPMYLLPLLWPLLLYPKNTSTHPAASNLETLTHPSPTLPLPSIPAQLRTGAHIQGQLFLN